MDVRSLEYRSLAARILRNDPDVRRAVTGATLHFEQNRALAYDTIDIGAWRRWAESVKSHALTHLDRYLEDAARVLEANGVQVHWAARADDAQETLRLIVQRHDARRAVKGKSMLSEELEVNRLLEQLGVETFETDLGEYIIQLLNEQPSHILGPAIHRGLDDIRTLFHEHLGTAPDASPDALAAAARQRLRSVFLTADIGITGANFLVAETGTIALIENEGNIRLSTSIPRVHVALVGIEKVLPRWSDLAPFLQLASRAATGQTIGTFATLVRAPRMRSRAHESPESDGPDEVHVILVDNGRSRLLADPVAWEALRCIRCGACLNVCPVYRQTGGHAYGWVYSGPIGAVIDPGLLGLPRTHTLPFASTLCGACADVCPVRIPIPGILLEWRARAVKEGLRPPEEAKLMRRFANAATRPRQFQRLGNLLATLPRFLRQRVPMLRDWTAGRAPLEPQRRSFLKRWKREKAPKNEKGLPPPVVSVDRVEDVIASTDAPATVEPVAQPVTSEVATATRLAVQTAPAHGTSSQTRRVFAGGTLGPVFSRPARFAPPLDNAVLRAVRQALENRPRLAHPGPLQAADPVATEGTRDAVAITARFCEQFRANGGEVVTFADSAATQAWLKEFVHGFTTAAVSPLVPDALSPITNGVSAAPPETAQIGVSFAIGAAAETGTLLLDSRERRGIQLLPPVHLVWVRRNQISRTLGHALEELREHAPAAIGLHSGPSKSADIGRIAVTGVHGPGRVIAAILP